MHGNRKVKHNPTKTKHAQRAHNTITTSLLRQNDVATLFWRNNDVIIASCVRWDEWSITVAVNPQYQIFTDRYISW